MKKIRSLLVANRSEIAIRVWLDGYFWFPRKLFGIEPHMLAFYDQARPDSPTTPGYLGFGAVPTMDCQAAAPAAQ